MKISILTPSYNSGQFIEKAIWSVINQSYQSLEHIIVDGNSCDNTQDILSKYNHLNWISESDLGQSDAMNKALEMSSGDIIGFLNADDWYEPNIMESVVAEFDKNPDAEVIVGDYYVIRNGQKKLKSPHYTFYKIFLHFKYLFPTNPVSYFCRRTVFEAVGKFPVENQYTMDYWFLLRAAYLFRFQKIDLVMGTYYLNESSKTFQNMKENKKLCRNEAIYFAMKINPLLIIYYFYNIAESVLILKLNRWFKDPVKKLIVHLLKK